MKRQRLDEGGPSSSREKRPRLDNGKDEVESDGDEDIILNISTANSSDLDSDENEIDFFEHGSNDEEESDVSETAETKENNASTLQQGLQRLVFLQKTSVLSVASEESENNEERNEVNVQGKTIIYRRGLPFPTYIQAKEFRVGSERYDDHKNGLYVLPAAVEIRPPPPPESSETEQYDVCSIGEVLKTVPHPTHLEEEHLEEKEWEQFNMDEYILENGCPLCDFNVDPPETGDDAYVSQTIVGFYSYYNSAIETVNRDVVFEQLAEYWNACIHKPFAEIDYGVPKINAAIVKWHFKHSKVLQRRLNMETLEDKVDCAIQTLEKNGLYAMKFSNGRPDGEVFVTERGVKMLQKLVRMKKEISDCNIKNAIVAKLGNDFNLINGQLTVRKVAMMASNVTRKGAIIRGTNKYGNQIREFHA